VADGDLAESDEQALSSGGDHKVWAEFLNQYLVADSETHSRGCSASVVQRI
jgi:hypothetical protein